MDIYYNSKLADRIASGEYGIQYIDHKVQAQILEENESELFKVLLTLVEEERDFL